MEEYVFDRSIIDQLVEDMKNPQKRSAAGAMAENMVMKVFQELDPDIRKCGGNKHQMDLTSAKYGFRIEVKCKRLDIGDLPSTFYRDALELSWVQTFIYINLAPVRNFTEISHGNFIAINGYEMKRYDLLNLFGRLKSAHANPLIIKSMDSNSVRKQSESKLSQSLSLMVQMQNDIYAKILGKPFHSSETSSNEDINEQTSLTTITMKENIDNSTSGNLNVGQEDDLIIFDSIDLDMDGGEVVKEGSCETNNDAKVLDDSSKKEMKNSNDQIELTIESSNNSIKQEDQSKYQEEAKEILGEMTNPEDKVEHILRQTFIEEFYHLKTSFIPIPEYSNFVKNMANKLYGAPAIRISQAKITDFMLRYGVKRTSIPNGRLTSNGKQSKTKTFSFKTMTEIENKPRNGHDEFQRLFKELDALKDVPVNEKDYNFEFMRYPIDDGDKLDQYGINKRNAGTKTIMRSPKMLDAVMKIFYMKNLRCADRQDHAKFMYEGKIEVISLGECCGYLRSRNPAFMNITNSWFQEKRYRTATDEVDDFIKRLKGCIEKHIPFKNVQITSSANGATSDLYECMRNLRYDKSLDGIDKGRVNDERLEAFRSRASEINRIMTENRGIIEEFELHGKTSTKFNSDGTPSKHYCYDFLKGIMGNN